MAMSWGKSWKLTVLDVLLVLIVAGAVYVGFYQDRYFEVKGNDIMGASATFLTLEKKGLCVDAVVRGYLQTSEIGIVEGQIIDGTRSKLYIYDGKRVWVAGSEQSSGRPQLFPEDIIPADIVPLTITMKTRECEIEYGYLDVESLGELESVEGFVSFYGVRDAEVTDAEARWLARKVSREVGGETLVGKDGNILTVYARNVQARDVRIIRENVGELLLSDVTVKRLK